MPIKVKLYNQKAEVVGEEKLSDEVFNLEMNMDLVHQAFVTQQANERQVLAHTKGRSEVRGGGKKPWRQKGTGRARAGSSRSPIWRGGGVTFGPTNERNFKKKINKKMNRKALNIVLSDRAKNENLAILDKIELADAKTKEAQSIAKNIEKNIFKQEKSRRSLLIIIGGKDEKLKNAFKNLSGLALLNVDNINIVDLLKYRNLAMTKDCVEILEKTKKSLDK